MAQKLIRKTYHAETKAAEGENRTLIVTISTVNPDRSKDVVVPGGMDSTNYMGNPVVAAFHNYNQPAIGRTKSLQILDDRVIAEVEFLPKGIYPLADQLYEMYKSGFMSAWSIGFIPKEVTDIDPDNWRGGNRFDKWELLEYSAVTVPDNPEALTMLRSKGFEVEDNLEDLTAKEIEKARAHAAKAAEKLEAKGTDEQTNEEAEEQEEEDAPALRSLKRISDSETDGLYLVTYSDDSTETLTANQWESIQPKSIEKPETPQPTQDHHMVLPLVEALKTADKVIGMALRNVNERANKDN